MIHSIRFVTKLFEKGSVAVTGLRGRGKDMLTANVIDRRKKPYMSNYDYNCKKSTYIPLDLKALQIGGNTYLDFINGTIKPFVWPYPDGMDVYLSDIGVYFPSQYCNELNNKFKGIPTALAISRHLGFSANYNVQNFNRVWDKFRELSDFYLTCNWCKVLPFGIVLQKITIYDKYQSCVDRVKPYKELRPLLSGGEARATYNTSAENYRVAHGEVTSHILIYRNKTKYDTHIFKSILKGDFNEKQTPKTD